MLMSNLAPVRQRILQWSFSSEGVRLAEYQIPNVFEGAENSKPLDRRGSGQCNSGLVVSGLTTSFVVSSKFQPAGFQSSGPKHIAGMDFDKL
jgi:hypothetical protein